MSMNETQEMPFIGRCKVCDYAFFTTPEDLLTASSLNDVHQGRAYKLGNGVLSRCPSNHKAFRLLRIEGEYSEDFKCDARCLNAKGRVCKCSCGGLNHGRGHAATVIAKTSNPLRSAPYRLDPETGEKIPVEEGSYVPYEMPPKTVPALPATRHLLGAPGEKIYGWASVVHKQDVNDSILYVFHLLDDATMKKPTGAKIKWFCPSYADPEFSIGDQIKFRANVKRHEDNEYGKATVVTYFEEI